MFAIYIPHKTGANDQHLRDVGLGDLLDDVRPEWSEFQPGPDNGRGMACHWLKRPIFAGEFDWTPMRGGAFYLGKASGEKPLPAWFARDGQQFGANVKLADGNEWHIPIARQLPCVLGLDDGGHLIDRGVIDVYKPFYARTWEALKWFVPQADGRFGVNFEAGYNFVCLALSVNYRVNRDVASWLGLVRSDQFWDVAKVATEFDELVAGQKKTEPAGRPTSAGERA